MKFIDENNITPKFISSINAPKVLWGIYQIGEALKERVHFPVLPEVCIPMINPEDIPDGDKRIEILTYKVIPKCRGFNNTYVYLKED